MTATTELTTNPGFCRRPADPLTMRGASLDTAR